MDFYMARFAKSNTIAYFVPQFRKVRIRLYVVCSKVAPFVVSASLTSVVISFKNSFAPRFILSTYHV